MVTQHFLLPLAILALYTSFVASACHPRDFGFGATVCVCSEIQKCEEGDFANLKFSTDKTVISGIRTTKTGDRFAKYEYYFANEESKTNDKVIKVELQHEKRYQKILGFGAAFTDASGMNIGKLSQGLQERLLKDYFGPDGLEYRIGRVPIGGSDFSPRAYSLDDHPNDDTLEKFALQDEDLHQKIPFIKLAQQYSGNNLKMFGSAWSSPAWMKTNNELIHGGFLKGEPGTKYYKLYAKYLVKFLEAYTKESVPIWGITVVNEPEFGNHPEWGTNVLGFNGSQQRDFVKLDLGPELAHAGFGPDKVKLMIVDDNIHTVEEMTNAVLGDQEAAKFVSGVAFHWYANGFPTGNETPWYVGILDNLATRYPSVFFLSSEACELRQTQLGNWTVAEHYAADIIHDLNHHTGGWVEWNMALDIKGGPSWAGVTLDASIIVNATTTGGGEYYKQPSFYALGHFSKLLVPDSVRLHHEMTSPYPDHNTLVTVFERPDGLKVASVLNKDSQPVKLQLHDPASGFALIELAPHSVESFVWH